MAARTPSAGLRDDFNRANENPLSGGGNWTAWPGINGLQIVTNQVKASAAGFCNQQWNTVYSGDQEWGFTVATLPAVGETVQFYFCLTARSSTDYDGYNFYYTRGTGYQLRKVTAGSFTNLTSVTAGTALSAGDKMCVQLAGNIVSGWIFTGGAWSKVFEATDSTYTSGKPDMGIQNTTAILDDWFGGNIPVDSGTVRLSLTPSADEAYYVDSDTERLALTPSGTDTADFVDAATEVLALTPSTVDEEHTTFDSGTVYLRLTPSAPLEGRTPFDSDLRIVSAQQRFSAEGVDTGEVTPTPDAVQRFTYVASTRWSVFDSFK